MTVSEYNKSVDQFADNLYRFIVKNVKDKDMAKDVVQDTFEKLWIKHEEVDASKVKSWLFSTGYHTMIDKLRREKRNVQMDEDFDTAGSDRSYKGLKEVLAAALEKLPEIQRSVIMLRDYEGYDYKEIGEITGLNESQVKVYIFRARVTLKNYIGSLENIL